ncbi:MAG: DUF4293 family protein [Pedobacter sp.]|nr:MAG: DUF4293 family protein [Pedobacter sp.]
MIQRVQSIWLLLATLTISSFLFIPLVSANVGNATQFITARGLFQIAGTDSKLLEESLPLFISTIAVALICFANIFNFRNRKLQKRISILTIFLILGLSFWCSQLAQKLGENLADLNFGIGSFLPIIAAIFCFLSIRGINNDEKLIRSADRLR